jgi:hypothetical protein
MAFLQLLLSLSSYINENNIEQAITLVERLIALSDKVKLHQASDAAHSSSLNNNLNENSSVRGS